MIWCRTNDDRIVLRELRLSLCLNCVQDGIKSLIVHLVDTYSSKLESIDYVDTFRALKLKYDQVSIRLIERFRTEMNVLKGSFLILGSPRVSNALGLGSLEMFLEA